MSFFKPPLFHIASRSHLLKKTTPTLNPSSIPFLRSTNQNGVIFQSENASFSSGKDRHSTTILCVKKGNRVVMASDGQVTGGHVVIKPNVKKVRLLTKNIMVGYAGSTADALSLVELLEEKLQKFPDQLMRACVELAKNWRTDKYLRKLDASLLVADVNNIFEVTGNGDVLEPSLNCMGMGSGGHYAQAAAVALLDIPDLDAEAIVRKAMKIAGDMCIYTNHNLTLIHLDIPQNPNDQQDSSVNTNIENQNSYR